jgi:hypothetical protein
MSSRYAYISSVLDAIQNNNVDALKEYLKVPGVASLKDNTNTPLVFYVLTNSPLESQIELLKAFLDAGLNPKITNQWSENLMFYTIEQFVDMNNAPGQKQGKALVNSNEFYAIVKFLFDNGFSVDKSSMRRGKTAKEMIQTLESQLDFFPQNYSPSAVASIQRIYKLFTEQTQRPFFSNTNIAQGSTGYMYNFPQNRSPLGYLTRNARPIADPRSFFNINTANRGFSGGKKTRKGRRHRKSKTSSKRLH